MRYSWIISAGILLTAGCSAKVGPIGGSVDQARKVAELENQIRRLTIEVEEAEADLEATLSEGTRNSGHAALPQPSLLVTASGSAVRKGDDGAKLRWRIRSEDSRGRFLQTTGPVVLEGVVIGDQGEAVELGRWEIDPGEWRAGLREGFMGTAYAIDLPIESPLPDAAGRILARVWVSDARLEAPLKLESEIPIIEDGRSRESDS